MDVALVLTRLTAHLQGQLALFEELETVQGELLQKLDMAQEMSQVLALLARKNSLLDEVRTQNTHANNLVQIWPTVKSQVQDLESVEKVNQMLERMESSARILRKQDEEMIARFEKFVAPAKPADRTEHSRNVLNAFRALR